MFGSHPGRLASLVVAALTLGVTNARAQAWLDGWEYRFSITVEPSSIEGTGTLADFPLLLSLDSLQPGVFQHGRADGGDLWITSSDGVTPLDREVVGFDPGAEEGEIWFRAEGLSKTENGFFLYYGNPDTTWVAPATEAWNTNYRAVYHFDGDPGAQVLTDSSPAAAHATLNPQRNWTSADVTDAAIHQGWTFNGSTHHISTPNISTQSGSYVVQAWLYHTARGTDFFTQTSPGFWHVSSQNQNDGADFADSNGAAGWQPRPIPLNTWHHFAWVFDAEEDTIIFYYDGDPQPLLGTFPPDLNPIYTGEPMNPSGSFTVGVVGPMFFVTADLMDGAADEFRVHEGVLSPEWLKTEYRNQFDPATFYTFGPEEMAGVTPVEPVEPVAASLLRSRPNPFQGSTSIQFSLLEAGPVRLVVYDVAGREVARLLDRNLIAGQYASQWDGLTAAGGRAASGVYFLRLSTRAGTRAIKLLLAR